MNTYIGTVISMKDCHMCWIEEIEPLDTSKLTPGIYCLIFIMTFI
jgi:hypothetical protein